MKPGTPSDTAPSNDIPSIDKRIDFPSVVHQAQFTAGRSVGTVSYFRVAICKGCGKETPKPHDYCSAICYDKAHPKDPNHE